MMERTRHLINLTLALMSLAGGSAACAWLVHTKPAPARRAYYARVLEVAVESVEPTVEATPIVGHGTVRAKHEVRIVPQVNGKLVEVHEDLAPGKIIPEGELLFRIDPTVYEARVRQAEAEVRRLEASVARTEQEAANLDERIANAEQMLAIDEKECATSKRLYEEEKVGTQRDLDLLHQKLLSQRDAMIELRSRRSIVPHVKAEALAELDAARARHIQARHDMESTEIFCPFEARVELVTAYESQVVTVPFSIATLTDISAFELPVGIDPREMQWLDETIRPEVLERADVPTGPDVTVRWSLHGQAFTWRGHVARFERVDEATRTVRLVVEVRHADMKAEVEVGGAGSGTTLAIGMHCRAELPAAPLADALLVARHAVYDNRWVYVFERDPEAEDEQTGRLGRRSVSMLRSIGDAVLVDYAGREGTEVCELAAGEQVVVSPLVKPVVGMKVRLRADRITSADADPGGLAMTLPIPAGTESIVSPGDPEWAGGMFANRFRLGLRAAAPAVVARVGVMSRGE